jgi:hypothetical protein
MNTKTEMDDIRTAKARDRQRTYRRGKGIQPRSEYLAAVKSAQPWVSLGISRATYFRRRKKASEENKNV